MSLIIIVFAFVLRAQAKSLPSDFMLLGLTPSTQLINGFNCQSYRPFIGINTDYLCEKIPQLHVLLHQSNIQARERCQFHFRDHPWACQFSSKLTVLRRFLRQASKEASFYTSLSTASLSWTLINACIKGQINDSHCQCAHPRQFCQINPNVTFQWTSLITDGLNMSENFQQKSLFQINQMNKQLGRQIVNKRMQKECRCHGVSGSCELQVCRLRPSKFSDISEELYSDMYQNARFIQASETTELTDTQLIYGRRSINYCRANAILDYAGVQPGRECFSAASCEQACCQRGYDVLTEVKLVENCHCFFSWNIVNIQCQPCEKKVTRLICK